MSKLYSLYKDLKNQDPEKIYLFKNGIFYIALDQDAIYLSDTFKFKLTNLNQEIVKCGFPCSSIEKYDKIFKLCNLNFELIERNNGQNSLNSINYSNDVSKLFNQIASIQLDEISPEDAFKFIENLKIDVENISSNLNVNTKLKNG